MTSAQAARALQLLRAVQQLFDNDDCVYMDVPLVYDGKQVDGLHLEGDIINLLREIDGEQS